MNQNSIIAARKNLINAGKELNFDVETPYMLTINGREMEVFGYIPFYGSPDGAVIHLYYPTEIDKVQDELWSWGKQNKLFVSLITVNSFLIYNKQYFQDMLEDWGYFGPPEKKPHWI